MFLFSGHLGSLLCWSQIGGSAGKIQGMRQPHHAVLAKLTQREGRFVLMVDKGLEVPFDILISQKGMEGVKGFIDIRPTGRVRFKVEEVGYDE